MRIYGEFLEADWVEKGRIFIRYLQAVDSAVENESQTCEIVRIGNLYKTD